MKFWRNFWRFEPWQRVLICVLLLGIALQVAAIVLAVVGARR